MPVDKFGRMSDAKTRDTGVSLTYINNNFIRNDGGTPVTGSIDMRGNTLYNMSDPVNPQDVATKKYMDDVTEALKERKRKTIITAHASYHGDLIRDDYQFTFGGSSVKRYKKHNVFNRFLMPWGGYIKRFASENTGFKFSSYKHANSVDFMRSLGTDLIPIFTLIVVKTTGKVVDLGTLFMHFTFLGGELTIGYVFNPDIPGEVGKYKINAGDILNIRSEINTIEHKEPFKFSGGGVREGYSIYDFDNEFFTYLVILLIELDPF